MENKVYKEIYDGFSSYLKEKRDADGGRRKTGERDAILNEICAFKGHFDINMLHARLDNTKFRVSKATLYNTLNILIEAKIIVRHHFDSGLISHHPHIPPIPVMYELRKKAESHLHFICTQCYCIREVKHPPFLKNNVTTLKSRFTPEYLCSYVYGMCGRCKNKMQKDAQKNKSQSNSNNSEK
ncbi:MAG: transcriptional repressor [Tannerellaceae bacterium]|jgi:Fur family ferric uptake transcriptional regulator|nr:transcriptional repressor [Tannerellaceae bacterium]